MERIGLDNHAFKESEIEAEHIAGVSCLHQYMALKVAHKDCVTCVIYIYINKCGISTEIVMSICDIGRTK